MKKILSVRNLNLKGKKVLIRVDFNVPLASGKVTDDARIKASLPTIQYVLDQGAAVILMSHLGRPSGKPDLQYSLSPCAKRLSELIKKPVQMAQDSIGPQVEQMARDLKPGEILLLENLRFHKGEEKPAEEPEFASALASLGDVYINDAFATAHRAHASTTVMAQFFPGKAAAGFLMENEIAYLGTHLLNPKRPFHAILGGAKISTKFKIIESLMQKADVLMMGGAMANNFFKAEQMSIGDSLYEQDFIGVAREILDVGHQSHARILLPIDVVITKEIKPHADSRVIDISKGIPKGFQAVDIGPKTVQSYAQELQKAATVFWNGPLGVFECPPFDQGTQHIASVLSGLNATTIVGGGDTGAAIEEAGVANRMSHISTGGGASLEFIEFGTLPGIEALSQV